MIVRALTPHERERMRECLTWCQRERESDEGDDYTERRLDDARRRWPDVAELIGFALALRNEGEKRPGQDDDEVDDGTSESCARCGRAVKGWGSGAPFCEHCDGDDA